jgi:transaldolase
MNTIQKLYERGQSVWCDNLSRRMIDSGELGRLIDLGIVGITSNPTIFMKAITGGDDYDDLLQEVSEEARDVVTTYERLVLPDIADAADLLRPVYERTNGIDGYVSLEVNPKLAYETEASIAEARRLFAELDRPDVFIKVPATEAGIPAIETLIGEGINVNVTLIFSVAMYRKVMRAYIDGLKRYDAAGGDLSRVASVASFFVSRVDTLVDKLLEEKRNARASVEGLLGTAAVANAKLAYARFTEVFNRAGEFGALAARGARVQRPLWASTSTKNPAYPDTKYVDDLVGPNTVNTMPPETLAATLDHGRSEVTIDRDVAGARAALIRLAEADIDLQAVTDQLTIEGVNAFAKSFDELLANLAAKRARLKTVAR